MGPGGPLVMPWLFVRVTDAKIRVREAGKEEKRKEKRMEERKRCSLRYQLTERMENGEMSLCTLCQ